jgi:hypothetical protein
LAVPDTLAKFAAALKSLVVENILAAHGAIPLSNRVGQSFVIGTWYSKADLDDYVDFNQVFVERMRAACAAGQDVDAAVAGLRMPEKRSWFWSVG